MNGRPLGVIGGERGMSGIGRCKVRRTGARRQRGLAPRFGVADAARREARADAATAFTGGIVAIAPAAGYPRRRGGAR